LCVNNNFTNSRSPHPAAETIAFCTTIAVIRLSYIVSLFASLLQFFETTRNSNEQYERIQCFKISSQAGCDKIWKISIPYC
jgi:hypothetical protein